MTLESLNCPNCGAPLPDPSGRSTVTCAHCRTVVRVGAPVAEAPGSSQVVPDDLAQVRSLIERGNKIGAIKQYRELTGLGLKEAKDAVEAIERGQAPPAVASPRAQPPAPARLVLPHSRELLKANRKIEAIKLYRGATGLGLKEAKDAVEAIGRGQTPPVVARATPAAPTGVDLAKVQDELRASRKIEAIKLYRGATGLGLKESKDAVEAIAASTPGVPASLSQGNNRGCWNALLLIVAAMLCLFAGCGTLAQTTGTYRCVIETVKQDLTASNLLGQDVNAGYLVLAPSYSQGWDLDGSWRLSMNLFMPAWGSRGLGGLFVSARADDSGFTAVRSTLFADWQRHALGPWQQVTCR